MLKFIKHHMESIVGIEIFPLISLIIFVVFFIGLFIWIIKSDKQEMDEISRLPLDTKSEES